MRKERDGKMTSVLEELVSQGRDHRKRDRKDRRVVGGVSKKSSRRDRSREKSKSLKRHRKKSNEDSEERQASPKPAQSAPNRRKIRWVHDDKMFKTKFFRVNDEPIADGLTDTQIRDIRDRLLKESSTQTNLQLQAKNVELRSPD